MYYMCNFWVSYLNGTFKLVSLDPHILLSAMPASTLSFQQSES